jgi:hypothetical protein
MATRMRVAAGVLGACGLLVAAGVFQPGRHGFDGNAVGHGIGEPSVPDAGQAGNL